MKKIGIIVLFAFSIGACKQEEQKNMNYPAIAVKYPVTHQDSAVADNYFGTKIADPYRWLEDDTSAATKAWVTEQNVATFGYLEKIPFRQAIKDRLTEIWNYERFSVPFKEGNKYYYFKNDGLQNQAVMYAQDKLDGNASVVLDPNTLSKDGTIALGGQSFNKAGNLMAYQLNAAGSDWQTIYVKDMATGSEVKDTVRWVKFSGMAWQGDGFYYSRYPAPKGGKDFSDKNEFHKIYFHKIGTPQSADVLVYEDKKHPLRTMGAGITEDERFLYVSVSESTSGNALYLKDLTKNARVFTPIVDNKFDADYVVVDNDGDNILVLTNYKAPNQRLIAINANTPTEANWKDIIPEGKDRIQGVDILGNKLVVNYIHDASSLIKVFDLTGKPIGEVKLPSIGTVGGFSGKREDDVAFYAFTSFTRPSTIYKLDLSNLQSTVYKEPKVKFDLDKYETKQVFYTSKDGTKVPMFITHKKGLKMDANNPTLLYGYGGFDISIMPSFSTAKMALLENGGIYAVANIRGGGEYGEEWHKAGTLERKQNVFDDFIAAAEYLIKEKYTSMQKLAIEGRSNGGLLVGACMTQRPDLYKVAFPGVGVLDMLRYHKFTIGWAWATDYGTSEKKESFDYLVKYSPLHNVKDAAYPATLVTTADHDDRVVPAHSFKFISELQRHHKGDNPVLIRIETSAGHGAGKPTSKVIDENADMLSFMLYNMNHPVKYSTKK
ncbi:MAG: S9 family peptidase [Saprospiraceae bacterium]|nr:S9 family peptidase [Saprospiraceae bacterium]MBP7679774.1 S9 family peptidase [Saprospiraceae bacterium]